MGNERQRSGVRSATKSTIEIDFRYKGVRCRERIKLPPTPANLKRAELHRAAILHAIANNSFDYATVFPDSPNRFAFSEKKAEREGYFMEVWLEAWLERKKKHLKSSTYEGYKKIVNNILIPEFGQINLADFKVSHVRDWCDKQTCTNKRLANVQSVLRASLHDAHVEDELIPANPMHDWNYAKKEAPKTTDDIDPFDTEEQAAIFNACRQPQIRNLLQFAFWTGLRTSELIALQWGDIDWLKKTMKISRAKTQAADEAEGTKTRRGTREVKLLAPAYQALVAQKEHTFLAGGIVFLNPFKNEAWDGDQSIRKTAWIPALKLAGVRYRNPYQTRHTWASMMLSAGESPAWIAQQMGHADLAMIFRNYGRWLKADDDTSGQKAVDMFSDAKGVWSTFGQSSSATRMK